MNDTSLFIDPLLESLCLAIHSAIKCFICRACEVGVEYTTIIEHLRTNHSETIGKKQRRKLQLALKTNKYRRMVVHPKRNHWVPFVQPAKPIPYIRIHSGFKCLSSNSISDCFFAATTPDTVKKHIKKVHQGVNGYLDVGSSVQTIFLGKKKKYFPVEIPPQIPFDGMAAYADHKSKKSEMKNFRAHVIHNSRQRHPFFVHHRWEEIIQAYDRADLVHLVSLEPEECEGKEGQKLIKAAMIEYFHKANECLASGDIHMKVVEMLSRKERNKS
jgi:hypothetical protein